MNKELQDKLYKLMWSNPDVPIEIVSKIEIIEPEPPELPEEPSPDIPIEPETRALVLDKTVTTIDKIELEKIFDNEGIETSIIRVSAIVSQYMINQDDIV